MIMTLAGVGVETATTALAEHETLEDAVDALLQKPVVSGDKYIPAKPLRTLEMDPEQEERCRKGRWLQDQVNAVFSVAQTQSKTQPAQLVPEDEATQTQQLTVPTTSGLTEPAS